MGSERAHAGEKDESREEAYRDRPQMPESYGVPAGEDGLLAWEFVAERMQASHDYWLVTVQPDGRPHAVPVWGVWLDNTIHFGGGRTTKKARNLAKNPSVVVHAESGEEAVILEGDAIEVTDPATLDRIDDAYEAKYNIRHGTPVWALKSHKVHAWSSFPKDATRWSFEPEPRPER